MPTGIIRVPGQQNYKQSFQTKQTGKDGGNQGKGEMEKALWLFHSSWRMLATGLFVSLNKKYLRMSIPIFPLWTHFGTLLVPGLSQNSELFALWCFDMSQTQVMCWDWFDTADPKFARMDSQGHDGGMGNDREGKGSCSSLGQHCWNHLMFSEHCSVSMAELGFYVTSQASSWLAVQAQGSFPIPMGFISPSRCGTRHTTSWLGATGLEGMTVA